MQRIKLTLIPILTGISLVFYAWCVSYPVSIDSPYDFVYNHISYLYWLSLPILFASFFIVAIETKSNTLQWVMAVSTVLLMYSLAYFYYMIPGSDAHQFRSLTEYFISTGDLSSKPYHDYYQWPLFFILNNIAVSIMGLDLRYFEFILFGTIGIVTTSSLYLYASKARANGYLAVIAFSIIMRYFFNYQWAPFSLSLSLLLLIFNLDSHMHEKLEGVIAMLIIFTSITLTHAFIPVFFLIYCFLMYIMEKNAKYLKLFLSTSIIYLLWQIFSPASPFPDLVKQFTNIFTLEYGSHIEATLASLAAPQPYIDVIAQIFSRTVVVATTIITGVGFICLLIAKQLRNVDYAILLTGVLYSAIGLLLPVLGTRAITFVAIPASLGALYLTESKFKKYFKSVFLIVIIFSTFITIHKTFYDTQIFHQTRKEYKCSNFVIHNYNWQNSSLLLSHFRVMHYVQKRSLSEDVVFKNDIYDKNFSQDIKDYDCVVYTVGLGKNFLRLNYSIQKSLSEFEINHFNLIYNSGNFSYVFLTSSKK